MAKCVYCNADISDDRSMEICDRCGIRVWGQRMWETIRKTTDNARDNNDLALYKEQEAQKGNPLKWKDVAGTRVA